VTNSGRWSIQMPQTDKQEIHRAEHGKKLRRIRKLLAEIPEPDRHLYDTTDFRLRDCHYCYSRYAATREARRNGMAGKTKFRCPLHHRCPSCLSPWRIKAARRQDYIASAKALEPLCERGRPVCYVLSGTCDKPLTRPGRTLESIMHKTAIDDLDWGAEITCLPTLSDKFRRRGRRGAFTPVLPTGENAPPLSASHPQSESLKLHGINILVVIRPDLTPQGTLSNRRPDFSCLGAGVKVEHRSTFAEGWELHLERIAETIERAADADVVAWMCARGHRSFRGIHALKGARHRYDSQVKADRRNKGILPKLQVTVFDERERHESVEERTEQKLRQKLPNLKDCYVGQFMSQVKPLIRESTDRADSVPEDEELTPEQRAANAAVIETMRQQIADLQGEVEKLERRQQPNDLTEPDYRKSKPLVQ
jgi:hypothetical protein